MFVAETLAELYASHRGKVSDKWSSYLPTYDRLFAEFRDRPIHLLEIGVQNGGSLELWAKYFPKAKTITGIDINPKCGELKFDDPRIFLAIEDASIGEPWIPKYDIIIDDGSHHPLAQIQAFERWFPRLNDSGIYVIEDMHCDNCIYAVNQLEGYGKDLVIDDRRAIKEDDRISLNIARVEYLNSMMVFIKGNGSLGPRIIAGQIEAVAPGHLGMHGTYRHA